jgi:hypothetical protein
MSGVTSRSNKKVRPSLNKRRVAPIPLDGAGRPIFPIELGTLTIYCLGEVRKNVIVFFNLGSFNTHQTLSYFIYKDVQATVYIFSVIIVFFVPMLLTTALSLNRSFRYLVTTQLITSIRWGFAALDCTCQSTVSLRLAYTRVKFQTMEHQPRYFTLDHLNYLVWSTDAFQINRWHYLLAFWELKWYSIIMVIVVVFDWWPNGKVYGWMRKTGVSVLCW